MCGDARVTCWKPVLPSNSMGRGWRLKLGHQAWWPVPLPSELAGWSKGPFLIVKRTNHRTLGVWRIWNEDPFKYPNSVWLLLPHCTLAYSVSSAPLPHPVSSAPPFSILLSVLSSDWTPRFLFLSTNLSPSFQNRSPKWMEERCSSGGFCLMPSRSKGAHQKGWGLHIDVWAWGGSILGT